MPAKKASSSQELLVRIKPYNARRKHLVRVWVHAPSGKRFEEKKGWYRISDPKLIASLEGARQIEGDIDSQPVFDIVTAQQAKLMDQLEKRESVKRADAENANDLSTADFGRRRAEDAVAPPEDRRAKTIRNLDRKSAAGRGARSMRSTSDEEERSAES